ncbi:YbaK/EbsC family protein [Bacillus sp. NPDC077027]|uniref:YbaK/EbsC family protein n=1 Tax=Bacillus sp. NPDC077027 TaxID=3390548 RepID=UPI003D090ADF
MSIENVKTYFRQWEMEERIIEVSGSSATVEQAAEALQCEPERIAKSLSFQVDDRVILIVVAGDAKIDNKKYKEQFGIKAKMIRPDEVETLIGHAVGGVCPFAINDGVEVYLDESLKRFTTVFPACGSSNSAIELTIDELEKFSGFKQWMNVCKGWLES